MMRLVRKAVSGSVPLTLVLLGLSGSALMGQVQTIGQWSTMSQTMPINPIHVTLLANGKILVVAGSGNCPPSLSGCPSGPPYGPSNNSGAAVFDPSTGTITQLSVSWDMFCNAMVLLPDGRAFVMGARFNTTLFKDNRNHPSSTRRRIPFPVRRTWLMAAGIRP